MCLFNLCAGQGEVGNNIEKTVEQLPSAVLCGNTELCAELSCDAYIFKLLKPPLALLAYCLCVFDCRRLGRDLG